MTVKETTDATFVADTQAGVTITDFWATWCAPCRMQSPVLDAVAAERTDVTMLKMDVDSNAETPSELGIRAIPTLIVKKDGEIVERLTGFTPADELNRLIDRYQ